MAFEILRELFDYQHTGLTPNEQAVMWAVAYHADRQTRAAWPSNVRLAEETRLSRFTVSRAVSGLIEKGYLTSVVRANYDRTLTVTPTSNWQGACSWSKGDCSTSKGGLPDEQGGFAQEARGIAPRAKEPVTNQSVNQSRNRSRTSSSPDGEERREGEDVQKTRKKLLEYVTIDMPRKMLPYGHTPSGAPAGGDVAIARKIKRLVEPDTRLGLPAATDVEELFELAELYALSPVVWNANAHPAHDFLNGDTIAMLRNIRKGSERSRVETPDDDGDGWGEIRSIYSEGTASDA